jgi:dTDP-4-amino-4,6-dideoxygalactose transaminase
MSDAPRMDIPPLRLAQQHAPLRDEMLARLAAVLDSGGFILGKQGAELEARLAEYCGAKHAVALNSGTDALIIGLAALGVNCGEEVVMPPFTFIATAEAARWLGARPVFCDIDPATFNLDPAPLEAVLTPDTRVVIPVHLYGHPADMDRILEICDPMGISVLEDMAQAVGASYKGRKVGGLSAAAALSFYPTKNLGACGDGGMLLLNRDRLLDPVKLLRNHGQHERYYHLTDGLNSRLDEMQAALLNVKLAHLDEWNGARREAAAVYNALFDGIAGVETPKVAEGCEHVYHQYTIRIKSSEWVSYSEPAEFGQAAKLFEHRGAQGACGAHGCAHACHGSGRPKLRRSHDAPAGKLPSPARRDKVMAHLRSSGVISMIYYPVPLHLQHVYKCYGYEPGDFPHSERAAAEVISLPIFPGITRAEQEFVAARVREALVG